MNGPGAAILSILMLATFALALGGVYLLAARRETKKGMLMLVAGAVTLANVLVWTL